MEAKNVVRAAAGRIGAFRLHGTHDSTEITAPARSAFLMRFLREADPEGVLTPQERERRAECLRKAHMHRLALKSAQARRRAARRPRGGGR